MVNKLTVSFSTPITLAANAIALATTGGTAIPLTLSTSDGQTYLLTFTAGQFIAGSLADGQYVLTVHGAAVTNSFGGPMASDQTIPSSASSATMTGMGRSTAPTISSSRRHSARAGVGPITRGFLTRREWNDQ
jgi:hypothetical protein